MLSLLLPSSQSAVQLINYLITALLPAEILPKLDFSEAIPGDCVTMVAVPTLLLSEKQVAGWSRTWRSAFWETTIQIFISHCSPTCRIPASRRRRQPAGGSVLGVDPRIE